MKKDDARLALHETAGPLNDLMTKLSGDNGHRWLHVLKKMLRKEEGWINSLNIQIRTYGKKPEEIISTLEFNDIEIEESAKELILSERFITSCGINYHVTILNNTFFSSRKPTSLEVEVEALSLGHKLLPVGTVDEIIGQLILYNFVKLGINRLIMMHEPIMVDHVTCFLGVRLNGRGEYIMTTYDATTTWDEQTGFAFLAPSK